MKTNELREKYLDFFHSKGHTVCPSDVMVPKWDKTVLFTPAGMNQFKDHFLGKVELEFTRATTSQKCLRTGDIENVGRTAYHHTFFEMLGNFSFGDYFKRDAIHWAWEFLTDKKWLGLNPDKLSATVYLDDDEAYRIWNEEVGLTPAQIKRLDEADNFWPASAPSQGPDGVCGPCSEIFYHPDNGPECEIWNLVFTQFNRIGDPPDNLHPLPSKNIDTGMGLERAAATLQGVPTNYHIDTLLPIVLAAAEVCQVKYDPESDNGRRLRRITDHIRAVSLAIHENVYPGSQKEESVVRLLLRRAVLQGYEMGLRDPFLYRLVPEVVNQLKQPYPELTESVDRVSSVIKAQEESFYSLVDRALPRLEKMAQQAISSNQSAMDAREVAELYQTHGLPATIAEMVGEQHGLSFDWHEFEAAMKEHGDKSGGDDTGVMGDSGPIDDLKRELKSTQFLGYEQTACQSTVKGLVQEQTEQVETDDGQADVVTQLRRDVLKPTDSQSHDDLQIVLLDQTPFYAESGGQVGDTGFLVGPQGKFRVTDTRKDGDVFLHFGHVIEGQIKVGDTLEANIDQQRRDGIRRAHTATHILHYALQKNLGQHAQQRGSRVADDDLRFDFANMDPVAEPVLLAIEEETISRIKEASPVKAETLPLENARQQGAMMLFGEKYPDPVRMISVGSFSKELCGGTHVDNSSQIESFEIVVEENLSEGTRRIQALTGTKANQQRNQNLAAAQAMAKQLNVTLAELPQTVLGQHHEIKELRKQIKSGKRSGSTSAAPELPAITLDDPPTYFQVRGILRTIAHGLNCSIHDVQARVEQMAGDIESFNAELDRLAASSEIDPQTLIDQAENVDGIRLVVTQLPGANSGVMRKLIDQLRKKASPVAILFVSQVADDKLLLATGLSRDLVDRGLHAGNWIKEIAPIVGGRGGGKPDMAQAGGTDVTQIPQAMTAAVESFKSMV